MTDQPLEITNLDALLRERDELRTQLARAENDAEIRLGLAFELGSEKAALLAQRQAALDPGPIGSVNDLCERFTVEEWKHAAYIAASQRVDDVCEVMASLRRSLGENP